MVTCDLQHIYTHGPSQSGPSQCRCWTIPKRAIPKGVIPPWHGPFQKHTSHISTVFPVFRRSGNSDDPMLVRVVHPPDRCDRYWVHHLNWGIYPGGSNGRTVELTRCREHVSLALAAVTARARQSEAKKRNAMKIADRTLSTPQAFRAGETGHAGCLHRLLPTNNKPTASMAVESSCESNYQSSDKQLTGMWPTWFFNITFSSTEKRFPRPHNLATMLLSCRTAPAA